MSPSTTKNPNIITLWARGFCKLYELFCEMHLLFCKCRGWFEKCTKV